MIVDMPRTPIVAPGGMKLLQRDMTAIFSADVTLVEAQTRLAEIGHWLAIDGDPQATLGHLIAFNSTGALRLGYGAWRDLLLGVQFTNGSGKLITAGGQTLKNVAGYDLTKLIIGSAEMFGKIVTLTVRTYRLPDAALLVTYPASVSLFGRLMPSAMRPQWAMITSEQLYCGYTGDRRTIDHYRADLPATEPLDVLERKMDEDIADRARLWRTEGTTTFRAVVPPTQVAEFAADLDCEAWIGDPAFGVVLGSNITDDRMSLIRETAAQVGGSIRFYTRAEDGKLSVDFSINPVERQIVEKLKRAFDPEGVLRPLPWASNV